MKELTILVPRIKPPEYLDIVTNELNNIFSKLRLSFKIKVYWITFQPKEFQEYLLNEYVVIDYHKFRNAVEVINQFKPDLIITEVLLGINGISFASAGRFKKIPVVTISNPGTAGRINKLFQLKMMIRLFISRRVLADVSNNDRALGFFRWAFRRYIFLLRTLQNCNYSLFNIIKFITLYPRIQIISNTYLVTHPILSGDLNICFNRYYYEKLLKSNFKKDTLIITGDPAYDHLFEQLQKTPMSFKKSEQTYVLLCLSAMHEHGWLSKKEDDNIVLDIINEVSKDHNMIIDLKIHPSSSSYADYELLLKQIPQKTKLFQQENTIDLMNKYDVMINYGSSNVVLDTILSGKPVVMYLLNSNEEFNRYFDPNVMVGCNNIGELRNSIKIALQQKVSKGSLDNYIENQIGKYDGKSAERIAYGIKVLLENKSFSN